jgi:hypothetical protein
LLRDLAELKQAIQFGTRKPVEITLDYYKEVHERDVNVVVRALSAYEYDEISCLVMESISNNDLIEFMFSSEKGSELPEGVNEGEYIRALNYRSLLIAFFAMKDFYPGMTIDDVKLLDDLTQIVNVVNEKSGRTEEVAKRVKSFREKQGKQPPEVTSA